jgi:hypothetical protein
MGRDAQQQVDMVRPHVPLQHFEVMRPTDLSNQISYVFENLVEQVATSPPKAGLRYFVMNTK